MSIHCFKYVCASVETCLTFCRYTCQYYHSSISVWHFITVLLALLISVIKYYRRKRQIQRNNNDDDAISTEIEELDGCDT